MAVIGSAMLQPAMAETVLRVAMTAGDVPSTIGQPDQGFEGYRFVGYSLYDPLILWDLSRADVVADLRPGLATSWAVDPADPRRWILQLRQGVKWHDGCDFTAADVVWNFARVTDEKAPQFHPKQFALIRDRTNNMEKVEAVDDYTVAVTTPQVDALLPYQLSYWFMISRCKLESLNYDYAAYQKSPSGTGPYKFARLVPQERLELLKNPHYWDSKRIPKHDRLVLIPMPEATTRAAALLSNQVDFIEAPLPDTIPRLQFGYLLGGSILVETVFTWPGTGFLLNKAILTRDIPMLQGVTLMLAAFFVVTNLLVDLLQTAVNPRMQRH